MHFASVSTCTVFILLHAHALISADWGLSALFVQQTVSIGVYGSSSLTHL